jgi:hypothetical protein
MIAHREIKTFLWGRDKLKKKCREEVSNRQLAHSMIDLSLGLETQSNLSKDHQEAVSTFANKRRAARCRPLSAISGKRKDSNETRR